MELQNIWSLLRDILRNDFSFAEIKDVLGISGMPIYKLGHIQQKFQGGYSKGQLMDEIDKLYNQLSKTEQGQIVKNLIKNICNKKPEEINKLSDILERFGWSLSPENEPFPIQLQINLEFPTLPENIKKSISTCLRRYRDGDINGSISAICASLDSLTEKIYIEKNLGNHKDASYQERISKSFNFFENKYKALLQKNGISDENEKTRVWNNYKKSINNAAYVLGAFRREFSDVHGNYEKVDTIFVQNTIDIAVYVIRNLLILNEI